MLGTRAKKIVADHDGAVLVGSLGFEVVDESEKLLLLAQDLSVLAQDLLVADTANRDLDEDVGQVQRTAKHRAGLRQEACNCPFHPEELGIWHSEEDLMLEPSARRNKTRQGMNAIILRLWRSW